MKKSKVFAALALSACMALGATGLIACSPVNSGSNGNGGDSGYTDTVDPIMEVYNAYVASAQASGEEPMSYDEWYADLLANAKGDKGDKGEKGDTGEKGEKGEKGESGNGWHYGSGEPAEEVGKVGDLYLDLENGDVWTKEADGWQMSELNIKGEGSSQGGVVKDFGHIDLESGEGEELSFEGVEYGVYYLVANPSDEAAANSLYAIWEGYACDMSSTLYSGYAAVFVVREGVETVTLHNGSTTAMSMDVTLVPFVAPTITANSEVEIPQYRDDYIAIPLDSSLQGKKVKITVNSGGGSIFDNTDEHNKIYTYSIRDRVEGSIFAAEVDLSQFPDVSEICLTPANGTVAVAGGSYSSIKNCLIKIELVEA